MGGGRGMRNGRLNSACTIETLEFWTGLDCSIGYCEGPKLLGKKFTVTVQ